MKNKNPRIEELILALKDESRIRVRIPEDVLSRLMELDGTHFPDASALLRHIEATFPSIVLSDAYRQRKEHKARERREIMREGEFAPRIHIPKLGDREPDEGLATPKQKRFLRTLGVRDEKLLATLGKKQASKLIEEALQQREKSEGSKSGCLGVLLFGLLFLTGLCAYTIHLT